MSGVAHDYIGVGMLIIIGISFPVISFILNRLFRPMPDRDNPNITRTYFQEGYEVDHSNYPRRLTTYECGSDPIGEAQIQFHFQYYWYALIFLVFDVAFMFIALGGMLTVKGADEQTIQLAVSGAVSLLIFFAITSLGVWHVFRKRGKIYI